MHLSPSIGQYTSLKIMKLNRYILDPKWNNFLVEHFAWKWPQGPHKNWTKTPAGFEPQNSLLKFF